MKKVNVKRVVRRLPEEFYTVSKRNRVFKDRKKELAKTKCRRKESDDA